MGASLLCAREGAGKTAPPEPKLPEFRVPLTPVVPSVPLKVTCEELVVMVTVLPDQVPVQAVGLSAPRPPARGRIAVGNLPAARQGEAEGTGVISRRVGLRRYRAAVGRIR